MTPNPPTPDAEEQPPQLRGAAEDQQQVVTATSLELLDQAHRAVKAILAIAAGPGSKLNKSEVNAINGYGTDIVAIVGALGLQVSTLKVQVLESEAEVVAARAGSGAEPGCAGGSGRATYASALRTARGAEPRPISVVQGPELAFYPSEGNAELKTAEDTKTELKKTIDPKAMSVGIEKVRKVGNAGVVVQTTSTAAAEKLRAAVPPTLRVADQKRRLPLVALNNVEGDPSFEEVVECLHRQNLADSEWTLPLLQEQMKGVFKKGRRQQNTTTVVFSAASRLRDYLIGLGTVYIGWMAVDVTDYVRVTCCSKCQQYGHPEKFCRAAETVCGRCGLAGHRTEACSATKTCCATCKRFGRDAGHPTASRDCPARIHAESRLISSTQYGC